MLIIVKISHIENIGILVIRIQCIHTKNIPQLEFILIMVILFEIPIQFNIEYTFVMKIIRFGKIIIPF